MNDEALIAALTPAMLQAGELIMDVHASQIASRLKDDGSPVSEADEAAEAILLPAIKEAAPDIAIISEENAASHHLAAPDCFFLVDPLDGTKEFLKQDGTGSFTVNIGLIRDGMPSLGLIYAPAFNALYTGIVGKGAWKTDASAIATSISMRTPPETGAVAVASASHRDDETNRWLAEHEIHQITSIGSSLKFCLLAEGKADFYPRFGPTMEWDTAAGDAILRAAGGITRFPDGTPFSYGKKDYRNGAFICSLA